MVWVVHQPSKIHLLRISGWIVVSDEAEQQADVPSSTMSGNRLGSQRARGWICQGNQHLGRIVDVGWGAGGEEDVGGADGRSEGLKERLIADEVGSFDRDRSRLFGSESFDLGTHLGAADAAVQDAELDDYGLLDRLGELRHIGV